MAKIKYFTFLQGKAFIDYKSASMYKKMGIYSSNIMPPHKRSHDWEQSIWTNLSYYPAVWQIR
jgi:hypothetical protein